MRTPVKRLPVTFSPEDSDLAQCKWGRSGEGYAVRYEGAPVRRTVKGHREVMERMLGRPLLSSEIVDHINRDIRDNRRENLRVVTRSQNAMNRKLSVRNKSGVTGVVKVHEKRWLVYISADKRLTYLGFRETLEEAASLRHAAEIEHYGEFAPLSRD